MTSGAFKAAKATTLDFRPMMHMQEYLDQMIAEDRHPAHVRQVRSGLHHFGEYLRKEGVLSPDEITRSHLVRFQAICNGRVTTGEWKKSYAIQLMKKVRAWLNWMYKLHYITSMPWVEIRLPEVEKEPNPLSDEEFSRLMEGHRRDAFSGNLDPFSFHRRETLLCLLYGWGLRIHELEALTVQSMDLRLDFVLVINKGGRKKKEPYTPEIKTVLRRWLAVRSKYATVGVDSLLITQNGTMLTKEQIYKIVHELGRKVGVEVNPHRLRDTMGTHMLRDNVPVERLQLVYGHADKKQTLAYAKVDDRSVYESMAENMDPRLRNLFSNTRDLRETGS